MEIPNLTEPPVFYPKATLLYTYFPCIEEGPGHSLGALGPPTSGSWAEANQEGDSSVGGWAHARRRSLSRNREGHLDSVPPPTPGHIHPPIPPTSAPPCFSTSQ